MKEKFTAIYLNACMSGSNYCTITKMRRFIKKEEESVIDALQREGIAEETVYLFKGWPLLQGEEENDTKSQTYNHPQNCYKPPRDARRNRKVTQDG